jgi:hypothetical protein
MSSPISLSDAARPDRGVLPITLTNPTAASVFVDAGGSAIVCNLTGPVIPIDSDSTALPKVYQNKPFDIKAWGRATWGVSTNTLTVRIVTPTTGGNQISATAANNTALITSGAVGSGAGGAVSGSWLLEAELMWDVTSLAIHGNFWGWVDNTAVHTALGQTIVPLFALTAANFASAGLAFGVDAVFSATNAGNLVTLDGFDIDPI